MYPDLFSKFGYFTERLIVTKEMKFFFKLLEDVLNDRLQSNEVNYLNQQRIADNFF
jgi:cytochrome P450 family 3 subfamily A